MKNGLLLCIVAIGALVGESYSAEDGVDLRQTPAGYIQPSVADYSSIQAALDVRLRNVVVTGNVVYDPGQHHAAAEGVPEPEPPRYRFAVYVSPNCDGPQGLHFSNNLFHPGIEDISNVGLEP